MEIVAAEGAERVQLVRELFEEYWRSFGFAPCFQNFAAELEGLPGTYMPPGGRLALALVGGEAAGCVALRRLDAARCEAKRLFVRSRFRGQRIGCALLEWVIAEARVAGYRELLGDTLPVMSLALGMYDRMGFERTGPFAEAPNAAPTPGVIYLRLPL
jgi:GNAT superfamily N-acetyltransferase